MEPIMKKYAMLLALAAAVALQGCNQKPATTDDTPVAPAPALETTEQRLSYGIALSLIHI